MKNIITLSIFSLFTIHAMAQVEENEKEKDTTRFNMKNKEVIIVYKDAEDQKEDKKDKKFEVEPYDGHWAGIDMGWTVLMNNQFNSNFDSHPYWRNDPAKSMVWNLNLFEYKFPIAKHHFGITTGLGFGFHQFAFRDNYNLKYSPDSVYAVMDTLNNYTKNKLKASYFTIPLLLEFNTSPDRMKTFYFAAGVVGGVRMTSKTKQEGKLNGDNFKRINKGTFGLNPFKLDAMVRMGVGPLGIFASYDLIPLIDTKKTAAIYPLNFGLTLNF